MFFKFLVLLFFKKLAVYARTPGPVDDLHSGTRCPGSPVLGPVKPDNPKKARLI